MEQTRPWAGAGDAEIERFHFWNPEHQQDPHPFFTRLRETCPVAHSNRYDGFWILSRYEDVWKAYQEPETFSSFPNPIPANGIGSARPVIPVEIDPPDHHKYRQILMPLFTTRRLERLEIRVREIVITLVEGIAAKGSCDYVSEFAKLVPTQVFLEMMGWPLQDGPMFLEWCEILMREQPGLSPEEVAALKEATGAELYAYFAEELDKRDGTEPDPSPDADIVDWLRSASFGGERPLSPFEILDCIFILLLAGLDTTQGVLSFSMEFLATHDEHRHDLVDNPEVIKTAIEELVRFFAPVSPGRRLTKDLELHGVEMKAEDRVMLLTGSACRDAAEFSQPEVVDFRRWPNRHIGFGGGVHRCLGAALARAELRAALEEWHRIIPNYRIAEGTEPKRHFSAVRGIDELQLVFP